MDSDTEVYLKIAIFLGACGLVFGSMVQFALSEKTEVIIGEVTNVEFDDEYMIVTFDNGNDDEIRGGWGDFITLMTGNKSNRRKPG